MDKALTDLFMEETARLPDVQQTEGDQFGEWAFRVHGREFLHVRAGSTLHFLLSGEAKAEALKCGYAHQHPDALQSDMVEVQLRKKHQLVPAIWLARQSYGYIRYGVGSATSDRAPRPGNKFAALRVSLLTGASPGDRRRRWIRIGKATA